MKDSKQIQRETVAPGEAVYDESGRLLGRVSALTHDGFEAEVVDPNVTTNGEIPGQEFGEGYLMWRCTECGEMGTLEGGMPDCCPSCDVSQEAITQQVED